MINSGLTKPRFNRVDDPMRYYSKPMELPHPKRPTTAQVVWLLTTATLTIYAALALILVVTWPAHVHGVVVAEEERVKNVILYSTNEADSWRNYVRGLIFDQYGHSTPWPEEPIPDNND